MRSPEVPIQFDLKEKAKMPGTEKLDTTEKLKARVEEMAKYWKVGFGNYIAGIQLSAEVYCVVHKEDRVEMRKHHIEGLLSAIEGAYNKIPFSKLDRETEEFKPLFEVNGLIPKLKEECEKLWSKPGEADAPKIFLMGKHIVNLGRLYDVYSQKLVREIRKSSGNKDYKVRIEHISGKKIERYIWDRFSEKNFKQFIQEVEKSREELIKYRKQESNL